MDFVTISSFWPSDWIIITAVMLLVALESFRAGTARAAALGLSLPIALYLFEALQKAYLLSALLEKIPVSYGKAIIFAVLFVVVFFFVGRIISSFDVGGGAVPAVLSSAAAVIFLILVWSQVSALHDVWHFGVAIETAFGDQFRFFWATGALGILAFARS